MKTIGAPLLLAGAACALSVPFLASSGVRSHLPFASTAFALPLGGAAAAALGGGFGAAARTTLALLPALLGAFAIGAGRLLLLPCALALVFSFALAAGGIARLLDRALGPGVGVAAACLIVVLATTSPWWIEPVLRAPLGTAARERAATLALAVNPVASACDLFGTDWMRRDRMYGTSSIGPHVPYRYPAWERYALAAATLGTLLALPSARGAPEARR